MTGRVDKSISKVGSDLDISVNSDLPRAVPDGKYPMNEELDNDVDRATDKAARGETTDDGTHEDCEDDDQDLETDCSPSYAPEILQQYHTSIGGSGENALKKAKSKQLKRFGSEAKEHLAPAVKRQKRKILPSSTRREESAWVPMKEDWEPQVVRVKAVERDDSGKLLAYILFKNGEQICVSMDKVHRHCPRPMLRFYEEHLRFGLTDMES